jgi:hypothetical protein
MADSQSVSQSVSLGVEPTLWTFDHILFPFQGFGSGIGCPVSVGRPLWREAGSVLCKSQSSHLSVCTFTIYIFVFHTFTIIITSSCIYACQNNAVNLAKPCWFVTCWYELTCSLRRFKHATAIHSLSWGGGQSRFPITPSQTRPRSWSSIRNVSSQTSTTNATRKLILHLLLLLQAKLWNQEIQSGELLQSELE